MYTEMQRERDIEAQIDTEMGRERLAEPGRYREIHRGREKDRERDMYT